MLAFVVGNDLGKVVEGGSDTLEEGPGLYLLRVNGFNVVGVFRD